MSLYLATALQGILIVLGHTLLELKNNTNEDFLISKLPYNYNILLPPPFPGTLLEGID